jgi:hypothetical protein
MQNFAQPHQSADLAQGRTIVLRRRRNWKILNQDLILESGLVRAAKGDDRSLFVPPRCQEPNLRGDGARLPSFAIATNRYHPSEEG